jgi:glyoxylase-like metal-dependent hydrolase (beta-lactamase superfamily II)
MPLATKLIAVTAAAVVASTQAVGQSELQVKVITSSPEGFLVNATLVSGARDAILIDAAFTRADAQALVAAIRESGKNLTTVYVTHAHPDHYFGSEVIMQAFPSARLVALPSTIRGIGETWKAKVAQWKPNYGEAITSTPTIPRPLQGTTLMLEGETLQIVGPVQGDDANNSYVWIPSLKAVIAGDVVYSGVHVWTAETNQAARTRWAATLESIAALNPTVVVPGHQRPESGYAPSSLPFTREYLATFDAALTSSKSAAELESKVKGKYASLALDVILKLGAEAAFKIGAK